MGWWAISGVSVKSAMLDEVVLGILRDGQSRRRTSEVWGAAARAIGRAIRQPDFDAAVERLRTTGRVRVRRVFGIERLEFVDSALPAEERTVTPLEAELMPALGRWLRDAFVRDLGARAQAIVRDTSRAGPRSGVWSRPDYTVASVARYTYSTVREVDLFGFELKRFESGSVVGVHEAHAHTRYVHFTHFVWHMPHPDRDRESIDAIRDECARLGVGFVRFADPDRLDTWTVVLDAQRNSPDPESVDGYIDDRFDEADRTQLVQWLAL